MKTLSSMNSWKMVATFGGAKLFVNHQGKMEMRGGSRCDQIAAREWISVFLHEAVLDVRN